MIPKEVFEESLLEFFAPVRPFMEDPKVSEIMINGPDQVFIEKGGKLELTNVRFDSPDELVAALRNAAQFAGIDIEIEVVDGLEAIEGD